jgi:hypothetical protein
MTVRFLCTMVRIALVTVSIGLLAASALGKPIAQAAEVDLIWGARDPCGTARS